MDPIHSKLISRGALVALIGYVASGPLGFVLLQLTIPQPQWSSPEVFARHYHIVQDVPFYFGFLLVAGMLMLSVAYYLATPTEDVDKKFKLLMALGFTVVFVALISFNYISQTTFVRHLALNYVPENDPAISVFSMANPLSFCWANEIWGYGFLGIATWFASAYYTNKDRLIRALMIADGIVSVGTAVAVVIDNEWLMTPVGITAYFAWNLLMIVLMILIYGEPNASKKFWQTYV